MRIISVEELIFVFIQNFRQKYLFHQASEINNVIFLSALISGRIMLATRRKSYFISNYNLEVNARNLLQNLIIQKSDDELILKEIFEGANVYSRTKGKFYFCITTILLKNLHFSCLNLF